VPFEVLDRAGSAGRAGALVTQASSSVRCACPATRPATASSFTKRLAETGACARRAVPLRPRIDGDRGRRRQVDAIRLAGETLAADAYVCALGSYSPLLLSPIGIDVPVYPVKGYSITLPIVDAAHAPESTIMDETHKVAVTRLGDRIRVGGTAELAGYNLKLREARRSTLEHVVSDLFPRGGDLARATFWCGLRPMTRRHRLSGRRYRNLARDRRGTLSWTMAAGTGRIIADLLSGRAPRSNSTD
jgi:D-amino-acid dehydrogenase